MGSPESLSRLCIDADNQPKRVFQDMASWTLSNNYPKFLWFRSVIPTSFLKEKKDPRKKSKSSCCIKMMRPVTHSGCCLQETDFRWKTNIFMVLTYFHKTESLILRTVNVNGLTKDDVLCFLSDYFVHGSSSQGFNLVLFYGFTCKIQKF